ncbi:MAG TPA: DUF2059 domain-containing protein [Methylomirabilota bacterium]|nr:DUF2059 domain-containing protein [Methylomirabilota bacterium]
MRLHAKAALVLALVLLSGSPAAAQGEPPEARELARLIFTSGTFDAIMVQAGKIGSQVIKAALEGRVRRPLTEDETGRLQTLFTRLMKEVAPQQEWENLYASLISRHFSGAEMRELADFYHTPLGAKALRLSGVMVTEGAAAGERLMKAREKEFGARFGAEFSREFPALSREIERQQQPR